MLDIESCIALSGLTEEEITAIARQENIPVMLAVELGSYLAHQPDGPECICALIAEDIRTAQARGDLPHAARLKLVLQHYLERHGTQAASQA